MSLHCLNIYQYLYTYVSELAVYYTDQCTSITFRLEKRFYFVLYIGIPEKCQAIIVRPGNTQRQ